MSTALPSVENNEMSNIEVPIVIDLGRVRRKKIKALKQGRGKLLGEIAAAISEVRANLGSAADGKVLVPVVLLYKKKGGKKNRGLRFPFILG